MNTYLFQSTFFEDYHDVITDIMNQRGNWQEGVIEDQLDYMYIDGDYFWNAQTKKQYKKALIKNVMEMKALTDKDKFYSMFKDYSQKLVDKYMMKQYHVTIRNYKSLDESIFDNAIWILKPVRSHKSIGIEVKTNYQDYLTYMETLDPTLSKHGIAVEEYIQKPLLLDGYKFHIRVYFLYFNNTGYLFRYGSILTAREPYKHSDWENKQIHDTHYFGLEFNRYPEGFTKEYGSDKEKHIFDQMLDLFNAISNFIKPKCYENESPNCYGILAGDIMILEDFTIKLLEMNRYPGLSEKPSILFMDFVKKYIEGQIEVTVDTIIPPKHDIPKHNWFVPVHGSIGGYYSKYRKYKTKYLALKQYLSKNI